MDKNKYLTQDKINEIWRKQWPSHENVTSKLIFKHRLFVEGYPIVKKYIPENAKKILDAGGGTGRYGIKIAQDFRGSNVVISDILDESLKIARKFADELGVRNIYFKRDDILNSSFPDDTFDIVLSDVVIQHLPQYQRAIAEMKRITKSGGRIIIAVNNWWNLPHTFYKWIRRENYKYGYEKSFTRGELKKIFESEGIKVVTDDGFYVGYGIFRLKKYHPIFRLLGRAVNKTSKILDKFTDRFFSKNFGMEIVVVGKVLS